MRASVQTVWRVGWPCFVPATLVCHARRGVPSAYTTSFGFETRVIVVTGRVATRRAWARVFVGCVVRRRMTRSCAEVRPVTLPALSTATTKSPPTTGRPRWVRS